MAPSVGVRSEKVKTLDFGKARASWDPGRIGCDRDTERRPDQRIRAEPEVRDGCGDASAFLPTTASLHKYSILLSWKLRDSCVVGATSPFIP